MSLLLAPMLSFAEGEEGLSLENCLQLAREQHPGLKAARAAVEIQEAALTQARSARYPQIAAAASAQRSQTNDLIAQSRTTTDLLTPANLTGQMPLYDFGRTRGKVGSSLKDLEAAREDLSLREAQVILEVREAYFEALRAESALAITESSLRTRRKFVPVIARAYERGSRSRFDLSRAETDLESALLDQISARARLETARKRLLTAIGAPEAPWRRLNGSLEGPGVELDEDWVVPRALGRRPEMRAARARVAAEDYRRRGALSQHLPSLNVTGGYALNRQLAPSASRTDVWQAGVTATLEIFAGFGTQAGYSAQAARLEAARQRLEETGQQIVLEARSALIALRQADARISGARKLLKSAEESLSLAVAQFERGRGGIFDLTDAQNQALRARLNMTDSLADYRIAEARVEKAVGAELSELGRR